METFDKYKALQTFSEMSMEAAKKPQIIIQLRQQASWLN